MVVGGVRIEAYSCLCLAVVLSIGFNERAHDERVHNIDLQPFY